MRLLPLALALAACSSTPPDGNGGTTDTSTTPTGNTTAGTTTGTETDSEYGHVVMWAVDDGNSEPSYQLLGVFAPNFDGLDQPAPCGLGGGMLCLSELPASDGTYLDWPASTFDPFEDGMTWIGDELTIGGFTLPFIVDQDTGYAGYRMQTAASVLPAFDVVIEGEWDRWVGEGVVPVANQIEVLDPPVGSDISLQSDIVLSWTPNPATTAMYVEITGGGGSRIWRVSDLGNATIPAADIPDTGGTADIRLFRNITTGEHDADGNTVRGDAWSVVSWNGTGGSGTAPGGDFSCKGILDMSPGSPDGVYSITPDPAQPAVDVWCDMTTDGGGWTLVGSSQGQTMDDKGATYHNELTTTSPNNSHDAVWYGMRSVITGLSDIRFACRKTASGPIFVDLSFYDNGWYQTITAGSSDSDSCFNESNGAGAGPPPARRDNMTGVSLAAGDQWSAGYIEGEDSCSDSGDFTVDFDDRGMDGNELDGTDWGEDDYNEKCGNEYASNGTWLIFVREP